MNPENYKLLTEDYKPLTKDVFREGIRDNDVYVIIVNGTPVPVEITSVTTTGIEYQGKDPKEKHFSGAEDFDSLSGLLIKVFPERPNDCVVVYVSKPYRKEMFQ